jgi:hypothetical protein
LLFKSSFKDSDVSNDEEVYFHELLLARTFSLQYISKKKEVPVGSP